MDVLHLRSNCESNLEELHLHDNSINDDDESAIILSESLVKNNTLKLLYLGGNNGITTAG